MSFAENRFSNEMIHCFQKIIKQYCAKFLIFYPPSGSTTCVNWEPRVVHHVKVIWECLDENYCLRPIISVNDSVSGRSRLNHVRVELLEYNLILIDHQRVVV